PYEIEAAIAPPWLVAQLQPQGHPAGKSARKLSDGELILEGARSTTLASLAGTMRRRGFSVEAIAAALLVENRVRCQPPLEETHVQQIAESIGRYPPASKSKKSERFIRAIVE